MHLIKPLLLILVFPLYSLAQSGENTFLSGVYKVEAYIKGVRRVNDSCILNVSKSYSYFFSLGKKAADEQSFKEFERTGVLSNKFTCANCLPYTYYKSYLKSKVYRIQSLSGTYYAYDEARINSIQWNLQNDSMVINNIKCFKAIGRMDTVTFTVFYAPSIPVADGPTILRGLPGLICKSESSNGLVIELVRLDYINNNYSENKSLYNFQFTTYEQFKAAENVMKETLKSGKEVQMANGATIRRAN